jgi:hypothetical protein
MLNIKLDANPSDPTGGNPSDPQDANVAAPSPAEPTQQEPVDPQEPTDPDAPSGEPVEPTDPQEPVEPQEPEPVVENAVVDKPEDEKLQFHKHPRFQELITEKNLAKQEVEKAKPLVEQATAINDFLRTNNITTQEFSSALQYLQALRNDPVKAFQMLKPTYEQLAQFSGEVLPPDLQAKVAAATMSLEDAQELAKARAQTNYSKVREQWQQNGTQQGTQSVVTQAIGLWQNTKMQLDPDLKEGTDLYKLVNDKIAAMPKFQTPEQAMAGCEKAYTDVKEFFKKYAPRKVTSQQRAPLSSRHSASGNKRVFKTAEEIARFIGGGGKPEQIQY